MAIPLFKVFMSPEAGDAVKETLYSGYVTEGPKVKEFEQELKKWLGVRYLSTTNSGTSALMIALKLAGVKQNSVVLTTPMTCSATVHAANTLGASVKWVDIDPNTGNMSLDDIQNYINIWGGDCLAKAILCVDWGGYPCDLDGLNELTKRFDTKVVEDAAHAFGSTYYGASVGRQVDYTCFSLQAIKHLTSVDGGIVISREKADDDKAKLYRWFGIDRDAPKSDLRCENDIELDGNKWHMNDVNATIGLCNLKHTSGIVAIHRANAAFYDEQLADIKGIQLLERNPNKQSSFWIYTLRVKGGNRDKVMGILNSMGIMASKVHSRNDYHSVFRRFMSNKSLPGLDEFYAEQMNIPVGWWVTHEDREYIVNTLRSIMRDV